MKFLSRLFAPLGAALLALTLAPAALAAPTVSITSPTNGSALGTVSSPAGVTITANAAAGGGASLISVDFKVNGTSIGTVATSGPSPYSATWIPSAAGTYTITAVATDSSAAAGNTTTSAPVIVTVSAVRILTLVAPANGASLPQGSSLFLRSSSTMSDAVVSSVEYFVTPLGALPIVSVGTVAQAPYNRRSEEHTSELQSH